MAPNLTDFGNKLARLQARTEAAKLILANAERTRAQISINVQLLERHIPAVECYENYEATQAEAPLDYTSQAEPVVNEAYETLIALKVYEAEAEQALIAASATRTRNAIAGDEAHTKSHEQQYIRNSVKLTIPVFKGDYEEFPRFRAAFFTAIEHDRLPKSAQLRLLEQHLQDRPLLLIRNLPPTDEGFDEAVKILDETFNIKERQRDAIIRKLKSLKQAGDDLTSTRTNYEEIEAALRALQTYEDVNANDELRRVVMSKFSLLTIRHVSSTEVPTLKLLRERLKQLIRTQEDIDSVFETSTLSAPSPAIPINAAVFHVDASSSTKAANKAEKSSSPGTTQECKFCNKNNHPSEKCRTYSDAKQRMNRLGKPACTRCLATDHTRKDCRERKPCAHCDSTWHHTALCPTKFGYFKEHRRTQEKQHSTTVETTATPEPMKTVKTTVALVQQVDTCYMTARAYIQNPITNARVAVRILLDSGSNRTFLLRRVASSLDLTPENKTRLALGHFMQKGAEEIISDTVRLNLIDPSGDQPRPIIAQTVPLITGKLASVNAMKYLERYPQLKSLQLVEEAADEEIALLLGNDFLWAFIQPEAKIQLDTYRYMLNTSFGWMLVGCHEAEVAECQATASFHVSTKLVTALWSLDSIGITDANLSNTEEEELALAQFNHTIKYLPDEKRYEVGLPCRTLHPEVPTNYGMAKAILCTLIRKYRKKPEYLRACTKIFKEQLESGIIELADPTVQERTHYIPYHWIERPGKSTPIRIVYNASAKAGKSSISLNEALYKGINLLNNLVGVLLRFRLYPVAVTADVAKAFHQITVSPEFRDYVRFLWRKEPENEESDELVTYRFRRLPFGVISSPFIMAATILFHLNRYQGKIPEIIRRDLYADNIVTSLKSEEEALKFFTTAQAIFDEAGMPLRQWHSNVPTVRGKIPAEYREHAEKITILGIAWDTKDDVLEICSPEVSANNDVPTMLDVLQTAAKYYDPLGLFTPVTINSRMFLQKLHAAGYSWTTGLTEEERRQWSTIHEEHKRITEFQFRRAFTKPETEIRSLQIHVFSDASAKAYGAAAYLRIETSGSVSTHLLVAKSRVTPLKGMNKLTIPRLELMGALLGSRLMQTIAKTFAHEPISRKTQWIDSKCVLAWLHTNAALPTFVKNRIQEIRSQSDVIFRYVPSKENPADMASRGSTADELHSPATLWWHGPNWLSDRDEIWPPTQYFEVESEIVPTTIMVVQEHVPNDKVFGIDTKRFGDFRKLIRVTALAIHFLRKFQVIKRKKIFSRQQTSVQLAVHKWLHMTQHAAFANEFEKLRQKKTSALIKKFRLFVDPDGFIRLAGRYQHAHLPYAEKHPILLPKGTEFPFVHLLILEVHRKKLHATNSSTLTELRRTYWVLQGRRQVAAALRKCRPCNKERARCYAQPNESILPAIRLDTTAQPLANVGIDIAGPVYVMNQKRWILLVTCLVSRAVILEDLENMETQTILWALQRAEAHTKGFRKYLSDNAPQFQLLKAVLQSRQIDTITWHFLPAHMPWAGGVYERLVKIIKTSLYATMRECTTVNDVQFRTLLKKISSMINDRPLTYQGEEFEGPPLTPNDILQRRFIEHEPTSTILASESTTAAFLKHQMKRTDEIISHFWNKWSSDYLQFLRERMEHNSFRQDGLRREPRIGDVVIIQDDVRKRRQWTLAKIIQLQRSADNVVRSAVLRLGSGTKIVRPVEKLFYMELNEFEDQQLDVPTADDGTTHAPDAIDNIQI